ncbi:MAG: CDP-glycerol glycerophosphotransferase, partial [Arcobacter sp.]|nr:CDP-glycerol glycerophosphotransferase [Arcobacter sp.]
IFYKPDIVLCATNLVPDFISGIKVQIFHGFNAEKRPSKKNIFSHFKIRGFFDLYCTQGPSTTSVFKNLENRYNYFKVVETGWSKMDPIFPIEIALKNNPPNILIASTFTPRLSLAHNDEVFQEIKRLASLGKYNFSMVLHPKMDPEIISKWKN